MPGTNSSRLVRELPQILETFDPDTLIIMVGGNDFWTLPVPLDDTERSAEEGFLKRHSLLYRHYYLFQRGRQVTAPEIILDPDATLTGAGRYQGASRRSGNRNGLHGRGVGSEEKPRRPEANLRRLVELARDGDRQLT